MAAPLNELLCMRHLALHSCPTYCRVLPRPLLLRCSRPNTSSAMADAEPPARTIQLPNTMEAYKAGPDQRVFAPAAARNKAPILETLSQFLLEGAQSVLEVASGTGEHTSHFAAAFPGTRFQPTDLTPELFPSIAAHALGLSNVQAPKLLDASQALSWEAALQDQPPLDAIICINMTHISPFRATLGLLEAAGRYLAPGKGVLFVYGPFTIDCGTHTSESNRDFDESLRQRNPEWGYRDVEDIKTRAAAQGLQLLDVVSMPANNFSLVFRKA